MNASGRRISATLKSVPAVMAVIGIVASFSLALSAEAWGDSARPRFYDARTVASEIEETLALGVRSAQREISALGPEFETAIKEMSDGSDFRYTNFSTRTTVEAVYNRVELGEGGDGDRFLARLRQKLGGRFASLAESPDLKFLDKFTNAEIEKPFKFAPLEQFAKVGLTKPLPKPVEKAIEVLSEHFSGSRLGSARTMVRRHFRKPGFDGEAFDRLVMESGNTRDVFRKLASAALPPPRAEVAFRGLLVDVSKMTEAFALDPKVATVMEKLSRELPPDIRDYVDAENRIPSRQRQLEAAKAAEGRGKIEPEQTEKSIPRMLEGFEPDSPFDPPNPRKPNQPKGPKSPSPNLAKVLEKFSNVRTLHERYVKRSFESRGSPGQPTSGRPPVSRTFTRAIRSARAARGIAAGAAFDSLVPDTPTQAFWLPNQADGRFGRVFFVFGEKGAQEVAASRVLFADSVYSAISLLWDDHGTEANHVEGEIDVIMSMDPDSEIGRDEGRRLENEFREKTSEIAKSLEVGSETGQTPLEVFAALLDLEKELAQRVSSIPRGIVIHPALAGRELAWSSARIDFWFNDLERAEEEAMMVNGGNPLPSDLKAGLKFRASTWQFYENKSFIHRHEAGGNESADRIVVTNDEVAPNTVDPVSHFSVSLFAYSPVPPTPDAIAQDDEDDVYRLPTAEKEIRPALDWFFTSHPDFRRLNDFSEAMTLLRWMKKTGVPLSVLDMDGQGQPLETPDRILIRGIEPRTR